MASHIYCVECFQFSDQLNDILNIRRIEKFIYHGVSLSCSRAHHRSISIYTSLSYISLFLSHSIPFYFLCHYDFPPKDANICRIAIELFSNQYRKIYLRFLNTQFVMRFGTHAPAVIPQTWYDVALVPDFWVCFVFKCLYLLIYFTTKSIVVIGEGLTILFSFSSMNWWTESGHDHGVPLPSHCCF